LADVDKVLGAAVPGQTIEFTVERGGQQKSVSVKLGTRPRSPASAEGGPGLAPPASSAYSPPDEAVVKVFTLRNIKARDAERIVNQLFPGGFQGVAADERTNSLIVRGSDEQLNTMYHILTRLDELDLKADQKEAPPVDPAAGPRSSAAPASVEELTSRFEKKDRHAIWLAGQIREVKAGPNPNQGTLDKLSADVRNVVGEAFALRQQLHQAELTELGQRMQRIQQTIEARGRISDAIIQRRVEDLLNPNLRWNNSTPHAPREESISRSEMGTIGQPRVQYGTYWSPEAEHVLNALGLETQKLTREDAPEPKLAGSLRITAIAPASPAKELRVGDIIAMMQITSSGGRNSGVRQARLQVRRGDENIQVTVDFPAETPVPRPEIKPTAPPLPGAAASATAAGNIGTTVTLRTPGEFRQRLMDAEKIIERLAEIAPRQELSEERKKEWEASVKQAQQRLELIRAEYAAQIRLLELEVNAATAELKNAEEGVEVAEAGFKTARKPRSAVIEARQQLVAPRLRLDRATTLLDLYRKADPQAAADNPTSAATPETPDIGRP
jgi:hypothetical protein